MEPAAYALITLAVAMVTASMLTHAAGYGMTDAYNFGLRVFKMGYRLDPVWRRGWSYGLIVAWLVFALILWGLACAMQYGFTNGEFNGTSLNGTILIPNIGTIGMNAGRQTFIYALFTIATLTNIGVFIATAVNDDKMAVASREGKSPTAIVGHANITIYALVFASTLAYLLVYVLWQWQSGWFDTAPRDAYDAVGNPWMFINLFAALCLMLELATHFGATMWGVTNHVVAAGEAVSVDEIPAVKDDEEFKSLSYDYDGFRVGVKLDSWFFHSLLALTVSIFTQFYLGYSNFFASFMLLVALPMFMAGWQSPQYIWQYFNICMMVYGMVCFFPYLGTFGSAPTWTIVGNPWIYQLTTWGAATSYTYGTQQVKVVLFGSSVYALVSAAVGWGSHFFLKKYGASTMAGALYRGLGWGMHSVGLRGAGRRVRDASGLRRWPERGGMSPDGEDYAPIKGG